jgi:hypothetical protein
MVELEIAVRNTATGSTGSENAQALSKRTEMQIPGDSRSRTVKIMVSERQRALASVTCFSFIRQTKP